MRFILIITLLPILALGLIGCDELAESGFKLSEVNDWAYWLQNIDLTELGASAFDLAVIDYSANGGASGEWTTTEIETLRNRGGEQPKFAIAYLSIGEAEDYRYYWQDGWTPGNPSWLGKENPNWAGNYLVKYWEDDWQTIVYDYLDRILAQGFDGIYLDKVDSCWDHEADYPDAPQWMVDFVREISEYGSSKREGFLTIVQNAAPLAADFPEHPGNVAGIGQEAPYFFATDIPRSENPTDDYQGRMELEDDLDSFRAAGGIVLTVDYCNEQANIDYAYQRSAGKGYIPYCTVVDLNELRINNGHQPD